MGPTVFAEMAKSTVGTGCLLLTPTEVGVSVAGQQVSIRPKAGVTATTIACFLPLGGRRSILLPELSSLLRTLLGPLGGIVLLELPSLWMLLRWHLSLLLLPESKDLCSSPASFSPAWVPPSDLLHLHL